VLESKFGLITQTFSNFILQEPGKAPALAAFNLILQLRIGEVKSLAQGQTHATKQFQLCLISEPICDLSHSFGYLGYSAIFKKMMSLCK
jgi:hypothetical protein